MTNKKTVLYVDGENFLFKVSEYLKQSDNIRHKTDITKFYFSQLQKTAFSEFAIDEVRFYAAKLHLYKNTSALEKQSKLLIESQRRLKRCLMNDGVSFVLSGHVRLQDSVPAVGKTPAKYVFKEKGTDVRLAIDALAHVCDGEVGTILLLSSDSDMQPMVKEVKKRQAKIVYVGFESLPNVGLSQNCDQTVLLRKKEIIDAFEGPQKELGK